MAEHGLMNLWILLCWKCYHKTNHWNKQWIPICLLFLTFGCQQKAHMSQQPLEFTFTLHGRNHVFIISKALGLFESTYQTKNYNL